VDVNGLQNGFVANYILKNIFCVPQKKLMHVWNDNRARKLCK